MTPAELRAERASAGAAPTTIMGELPAFQRCLEVLAECLGGAPADYERTLLDALDALPVSGGPA